MPLTAALLIALAIFASGASAQDARIRLPPGFRLDEFASGFGPTRFLAVDPAGNLLVSIPRQGQVVALPDRDHDGRADIVVTVADGLDLPHGLAFLDGQLYIAETGRVRRFRYDPTALRASHPVTVVPNLPAGGHWHWTRTIAFGPDGRLYVSVGSDCDVCVETDRHRAAITRYNRDGSAEQIFATGLRNAVGIAFHPTTSALWATVNERDGLGDDVPPDYITEVVEGGFYGWPDCFVQGGKAILDPKFPEFKRRLLRALLGTRCPSMKFPTLEIQAHSAPLGLVFYTADRFPAEYRGSLFVAYHGSWRRSIPTGYKIVRVPFKDGRPSGPVEDFATGWLSGGKVSGRPVDLKVGADGALYLSTDDAIFRINYQP